MASIIKVSPEQLLATASEFSNEASALSNLTSEMISLVASSSSAWTGEAATTFVSKFNQLDDDMTRLGNMAREYANDLTDIATVYQQAETANAEAAQALSADIIL